MWMVCLLKLHTAGHSITAYNGISCTTLNTAFGMKKLIKLGSLTGKQRQISVYIISVWQLFWYSEGSRFHTIGME